MHGKVVYTYYRTDGEIAMIRIDNSGKRYSVPCAAFNIKPRRGDNVYLRWSNGAIIAFVLTGVIVRIDWKQEGF
jgi:hypothetical protein